MGYFDITSINIPKTLGNNYDLGSNTTNSDIYENNSIFNEINKFSSNLNNFLGTIDNNATGGNNVLGNNSDAYFASIDKSIDNIAQFNSNTAGNSATGNNNTSGKSSNAFFDSMDKGIDDINKFMITNAIKNKALFDSTQKLKAQVHAEVQAEAAEARAAAQSISQAGSSSGSGSSSNVVAFAKKFIGQYNTNGQFSNGRIEAYCADFVNYCLKNSGKQALAGGSGYCPGIQDWANQNGRMLNKNANPQPGDAVLFDWNGDGRADHIGLVASVNSDGTVNTVEGNVNGQGLADGQVVATTRSRGTILGFVKT